MERLETRYGSLIGYASDKDLVTKFLKHYGEWSFLETAFVGALLPQAARVLDIGAFLGTFALGCCAVGNVEYVCAVEANAKTFPLLKENLARLLGVSCDALNALVVGTSPVDGDGRAPSDNAGASSFAIGAEGNVAIEAAEARLSLAEVVNTYGPFDLIKLDVEGMEYPILEAATALLNETAIVWVECNETAQAKDLGNLFLMTGRPVWYFAWPSHNPANFNGRTDAIFPMSFEAGLLLGPADPVLNTELLAAGCILMPLRTLGELETALWRTPRWSDPEWSDASRAELAGMLGHSLSGVSKDGLLRSLHERQEPTNAIVQVSQALALERFRVRQLTNALAETEARHQRRLAEEGAVREAQLAELIAYTAQPQIETPEHQETPDHQAPPAPAEQPASPSLRASLRSKIASIPGARAVYRRFVRRS